MDKNIIENAKMGTAQNSAYGYKDAVEKYYVSELYNNKDLKLNGIYNIENGIMKGNGLPTEGIEVPADGTIPTSGFLYYSNEKLEEGCLIIGEYSVTFDGSKTKNTKKGTCPYVVKGDGAKYFRDAKEVHYNPVTNEKDCEGESGCLTWNLYSQKGDYVNLILDHNLSAPDDTSAYWLNSTDYSAGLTSNSNGGYERGEGSGSVALETGVSYPEEITSFPSFESYQINVRGPLTALKYLKNATSTWQTGTPKVPNSSSVNEHIVSASQNENRYQIDYTGYKARLITKEETENLGCSFYNDSCPVWMGKGLKPYDQTLYNGIYGYWTSSPSDNNYPVYSVANMQQSTEWSGPKSTTYPPTFNMAGVRPVITLPSSFVSPD